MIENRVSTTIRPANFSKRKSGFGYIVIPNDLERSKYINRCYDKQMVTISTYDDNAYFKNCKIDKNILQTIEFPKEPKKKGTPVYFVTDTFLKIPVIVAAFDFDNNTVDLQEGVEVRSGDKFSAVYDKKNGNVNFNLKGSDSSFEINLSGQNSTIKLNSKNLIKLVSEGNIRMFTEGEINSTSDKVKQEAKEVKLILEDIKLNTESIVINEGEESVVRGNELKRNLNTESNAITAIINAINAAPIVPLDGGASFKASLVSALSTVPRGNFRDILNDKIKIE